MRYTCDSKFSLSDNLFLRFSGLYLFIFFISSAQAEWHGDIKLLSDYVFRGYSKSRGNPIVQGHVEYLDDAGWFAGLGASQVRFDDQSAIGRAEIEIKPYVGWSLPISKDWRTELSVTGYIYDNKIFNHDANYVEFYASLHYQDWISFQASIAPDAYQRQAKVANFEINVRRDILDNVQFSAGLGYSKAAALLDQDYFYWNAGTSWFVTPYLALDLRYVDASLSSDQTSEENYDEFYPRPQDNKYLFSVTLGF
jgi:uncharacterized protein (TIGR02001 family)